MERCSKIAASSSSRLCCKNISKTLLKVDSRKFIKLPKVNSQSKKRSLLELNTHSDDSLNLLTKKPSRCAIVAENGEKSSFELKNNKAGYLSLVLNENDADPGEKIKGKISKLKIPICRTTVVDGHLDVVKYSDMNKLIVGSKEEIEYFESVTKITCDKRPESFTKADRQELSTMVYSEKDPKKFRERLKMKQAERKALNSQDRMEAKIKLTEKEYKLKCEKKIFAMQRFIQRLEERRIFLRHNKRDMRPVLHLLDKGYAKWQKRDVQKNVDNKENNVLFYKSVNGTSKLMDFVIYIEAMLKPFFRSTFDFFVCLSAIISVMADTLRF